MKSLVENKDEMIDEIKKCINDKKYFIGNYVNVIGKDTCELYKIDIDNKDI